MASGELNPIYQAAAVPYRLHDRTVEFTPFLRAQEHSAQIDRASLQTYEKAFREGRINVLNWRFRESVHNA